MARIQKSMRLYSHPFSLAYWRDAALELRDTKMLVITALMVALRIALKPAAIPLGPSLYIQTATLATAAADKAGRYVPAPRRTCI